MALVQVWEVEADAGKPEVGLQHFRQVDSGRQSSRPSAVGHPRRLPEI